MATALEKLDSKIAGIGRAFIHHQAKGNIRAWKRIPGVNPRWNVTTHNGTDLSLKNVAEAYAFVCALASADQAATARENAGLPVEETSDRLGDHYAKYYDHLAGDEREAIGKARSALERIAEEEQEAKQV